jgi:DNA-binding XRE family transcriptional regulator
VAAMLGVSQKTIDNWERDIPIGNFTNENNPPDLRISVPKL